MIIIYYKRQIDQLKQRLRGRQSATGGQDQGSDVHLNEIHLKPDRSVHGQGRDLPASPPQTQHHDQADYEEVGTGMVAPPDIRHQDGAVKPDGGSGQYDGLVSDYYSILSVKNSNVVCAIKVCCVTMFKIYWFYE